MKYILLITLLIPISAEAYVKCQDNRTGAVKWYYDSNWICPKGTTKTEKPVTKTKGKK